MLALVFGAGLLNAQNVWNSPAFSTDPEELRHAAAEIKAGNDADVTLLLNEFHVTLDSSGRMLKKHHMIYRIESQDGVEGWSRIRGTWSPWYQARPKLDARVITPDGVVHALDPKTLNDVPVHEDSPDVYTDRRAYAGPLPALAPGSIVEEEVSTQDTAVFFTAGIFEGFGFAWGVPVSKTRFVLTHPESLQVHYVLHLLPQAVVNKASVEGTESITIEQGPMEAFNDEPPHVPPDAVLYPELQLSTGSSWQQVASTYAKQLSEKLRIEDVQLLVSKLQLGSAPNLEAIRKIVLTLHKTVRYTGVEFGQSGIIPQFPAETLKRKYGDCKDKATLLIAMLQAAGIPANLALLASGPGQDTNPDLPGMGGFDHAIVFIPATSSSPELWIDGTAQYSRVGELPEMDYGRWALIVDEGTTALKKTPELSAEGNRHVETREFTLADYGPAQITEKNEQFGLVEEDYRGFYDGDAKKIRDGSQKYVKDEYLADSLGSFDKSDPEDLGKPFVVSFSAKGRRGFTEIDAATVYIPQAGIFNGLPDYFYSEEKENKEQTPESKPTPRNIDWLIIPFATEWRYKIVAPEGFKVRALPPNKDEQLATAHFAETYSSNSDSIVVEAVLRFDSGKARLTIEEAKSLRNAILKARKANGININFDQIGYSLLSAGKIKEALAADRRLVTLHPKNALSNVRLASALLAAGLGEEARTVAKEAAELAPNSPQVFSEQGWILQHDLIGRRFGKGFDFAGAVTAYRKAKQLDPKDNAIRANLAILLEYDAGGLRYNNKVNLDAAIAEFKELKQQDENYARSYEDNVAYDLWYSGRFKELSDYISGLSSTDVHRAFTLACVAADDGPDAAIKKSLEITSDEESRGKALMAAGYLLLHIRRYLEAGDLLAAGSHNQGNGAAVGFAERLKTTKRAEELKSDASNPTSVIQELFRLIFSGKLSSDTLAPLISRLVRESSSYKDENTDAEMNQVTFQLRAQAEKSGMPLEALADIALSHAHYNLEGDDLLGYKVTVEIPAAAARSAFVVREDGQFKLLEFAMEGKPPDSIALEALARLNSNDLAGARKWLDWAREEVHINAGDDPLSGQPFPRFWTKGQQGDQDDVRTAALVLLSSKVLTGQYLSDLVEARNKAKSDARRADLNLVLAYSYATHEQWSELEIVSDELMRESPDSFTAFQFATKAFAGLKEFEKWDQLLQVRLQKHADEAEYVRSAADLARYRGDFAKARQLMKSMTDRGKATQSDLNSYAWDALFAPGDVDADAIAAAERGAELSQRSNFGVMDTLACLYAQAGRTSEARDVLLKAMNAGNLEEPNSEVWFAFGEIAAQYGENEAARRMFAKVPKPKTFHPVATYNLAQQRLAALNNPAASAKVGAQ